MDNQYLYIVKFSKLLWYGVQYKNNKIPNLKNKLYKNLVVSFLILHYVLLYTDKKIYFLKYLFFLLKIK